ncbi:MAG: ABC transporter ATP-binding protein [Desulfuromonadales bacterium]|nr:ABC transporter ATP-binding protein [Desulfuromonadales bacterium]
MHRLASHEPLPSQGSSLFSLRNLCFTYPNGTPALRDINLDIFPGDRIAVVGQNGAGKSTLLRHLNGLLTPHSGTLVYKGDSLATGRLERARLEIGLLFQDPDDQLFGNSVADDVLFGPLNQGLDLAAAELRAASALSAVSLAHLRHRPPHRLSYGQRKRAALAGLLAMQPEVLLLDEPTANLDPYQEELLLQRLKEYPGTLICITHNLLFAYELCERAIVLDRGHIHHDYSLRELVSHRASLREHGLDFSFRFVEQALPEDRLPAVGSVVPTATDGPAGGGTNPALIELRDFSYRYPDGTEALHDLSLRIEPGEKVAIVGENGAGKTTLVSCLIGLRTGQGQYRLNGMPINERNRVQACRQVGLVFQDSADQLFCPSCAEEVAFGPRQLGLAPAAVNERVGRALAQVGLIGYDERVPLNLSGGERKRLALAAVLAMQPAVLILDEPTAGLDPDGEERLFDILKGLDATLILVSHDLFFVRQLTRRTLVLHDGRLVKDDSTTAFFSDSMLTSLNQLDFTYRNRCGLEIARLQHAHEHSHRHRHRHEHPHRHGDLVHSHLHEHEHEHAHTYTHTHHAHPTAPVEPDRHDHLPRADRPHDHLHPGHEQEPHEHEH